MKLEDTLWERQQKMMDEFCSVLAAKLAHLGKLISGGRIVWKPDVYEINYDVILKTGWFSRTTLIRISGKYLPEKGRSEFLSLEVYQPETVWPLIEDVLDDWKVKIDPLFRGSLRAIKMKQ